MNIGPYCLPSPPLIVAPMAGVTDRPFRKLCRKLGASLAISEMVASDPSLRMSRKSQTRRDHAGEPAPIAVQIVGTEPGRLADAARYNVDEGAQIIDINMGCPAKKVCSVAAGSALLRDEQLVARILDAVVKAATVPVTLKIRTGWDPSTRNAVRVARIAEACGIQALAIHGRTRQCGYTGEAEYQTIAEVKSRVGIPVIANGDITSAIKAREVLALTGADGLMIGRSAQGRPWIFREIAHYLSTGEALAAPSPGEIRDLLIEHLKELYDLYGELAGVRIARKHIGWYLRSIDGGESFRRMVNQMETAAEQLRNVEEFFDQQASQGNMADTPAIRRAA